MASCRFEATISNANNSNQRNRRENLRFILALQRKVLGVDAEAVLPPAEYRFQTETRSQPFPSTWKVVLYKYDLTGTYSTRKRNNWQCGSTVAPQILHGPRPHPAACSQMLPRPEDPHFWTYEMWWFEHLLRLRSGLLCSNGEAFAG